MNQNTILEKISYWGKLVGLANVITGALSALGGLFMFVIGAIPGVITIVLGVKLMAISTNAKEILMLTDEESKNYQFTKMLDNLNTYLKIQGILILVGIIFVLLMILFGGAAIFSALGSMQ